MLAAAAAGCYRIAARAPVRGGTSNPSIPPKQSGALITQAVNIAWRELRVSGQRQGLVPQRAC